MYMYPEIIISQILQHPSLRPQRPMVGNKSVGRWRKRKIAGVPVNFRQSSVVGVRVRSVCSVSIAVMSRLIPLYIFFTTIRGMSAPVGRFQEGAPGMTSTTTAVLGDEVAAAVAAEDLVGYGGLEGTCGGMVREAVLGVTAAAGPSLGVGM